MTIGLDPIIVSLGPVAIRWVGLLALAGVGLGLWLSLREAARWGVPRARVLATAAWAIPAGVLGARGLHLLSAWEYYAVRPWEVVQVAPSGLMLWGAIFAGGLATAWALRADPLERVRVADAIAPGLALGIAVGRVGSFVNGDGQGLPADLPWATTYAHPLTGAPDFGELRHPAQIYDGLVALALFGLLRVLPASTPPGLRCWTFLTLYAGARVALAPVGLEPPFLLGMPLDQLIAILMGAFGLTNLARLAVVIRLPADGSRPALQP